MKRIFVVFSLLLCFALPAHSALIELTDGYVGVYDPANEYVPVGNIGPDLYSFQFQFTDPAHQFDVTLTAPGDLVGLLDWGLNQSLDGGGATFAGGQLAAGDSVGFTMGLSGAPTEALTIAAFDSPITYDLQGDFSFIDSDFGFVDTDNGGSNPIPVAPTVYLFLFGLIFLLLKFERNSEGKYGEKQQSKLSKRFLKSFLILPLIAAVTACGNNSELDRKQASKLLKQNGYPLEIVEMITTYDQSRFRNDIKEFRSHLNWLFDYTNIVSVASPSIEADPKGKYNYIFVKPNHIGKLLVRGEEKARGNYGDDRKKTPIVIYTVNFGEVTGIAFQNQEKTQALVEFTEVYTPTPFRAHYEKTTDENSKYSIEKRSRVFKLYDDGWRIMGSAKDKDRTPPPEGFSYEDVEKMLN